jgi:hypothetical protein
MSEALAQVKLEEPTEVKPGSEDSPAPEKKAESEEVETDKAAKTDEQATETAKTDDSANDHFHKRPEWGELNKALGKDGAAKARPIIRKLMEREHQATEQVRQMRPVVDELRQHTGDEKGFQTMRNIVRAYATDPAAAIPILEQMLNDAKGRAGHVVTSPDLKAKLDQIQKKVDSGEMDDETAEVARGAVLDAEKARAGGKNATARAQQTETQRVTEAQRVQQDQTLQTLNSWEENLRERDPDFGNVTPADDPKHGESVADQVFDALQLKFMQNRNIGADKLIAEANRVYKLARGRLAAPRARESRPVTTTSSSITAKPKARTMREAMDSVKLE